MKTWNDRLVLGALPGVELGIAEWLHEAAKYELVVNLVPEDEIAEVSPDYLRAKANGELPLLQEAPLPSAGPLDENSLQQFWEKAFVVKACIASGDTALAFDDRLGERTAMFAIAVMMQRGLTFKKARSEASCIGLSVSDPERIAILKQQKGLPKALRVDRS